MWCAPKAIWSVNQNMKSVLMGIDTLQVAYFLAAGPACKVDFSALAVERERVRSSKGKDPAVVQLGDWEFLLAGHGTGSGYPFLITNSDFRIEFGEKNSPSFFVTYSSEALWREGAIILHQRFMDWAAEMGLLPVRSESVGRVDFTFDYHLPENPFEENVFVSQATKDSQHREHGKVQTFTFGKGDIVLRVYDKVAEIRQQSSKVWFFDLWGVDKDVWRIEWQVRKEPLRERGIRSFDDLLAKQRELLLWLAESHDTLRIPTFDPNRSRWKLHPLWLDLIEQIRKIESLGDPSSVDPLASILEREMRMAQSIYGYFKRVAAIKGIREPGSSTDLEDAFKRINRLVNRLHDPLTWQNDVEKRLNEMRLGSW